MLNSVNTKLTNYAVYLNGSQLLGEADITLPDIEAASDGIKGPGIVGEVDMPTLRMPGSMPITINWRTINEDLLELVKPQAHDLEFRGALEVYDSSTGELNDVAVVVKVRALTKKSGLGKFESSATMDASTEMECVYLKVMYDNENRIEIDKFAYVFKIKGTDYMAGIRAALGL